MDETPDDLTTGSRTRCRSSTTRRTRPRLRLPRQRRPLARPRARHAELLLLALRDRQPRRRRRGLPRPNAAAGGPATAAALPLDPATRPATPVVARQIAARRRVDADRPPGDHAVPRNDDAPLPQPGANGGMAATYDMEAEHVSFVTGSGKDTTRSGHVADAGHSRRKPPSNTPRGFRGCECRRRRRGRRCRWRCSRGRCWRGER